jgi:hypothetical protein
MTVRRFAPVAQPATAAAAPEKGGSADAMGTAGEQLQTSSETMRQCDTHATAKGQNTKIQALLGHLREINNIAHVEYATIRPVFVVLSSTSRSSDQVY